MNNLMYCPGMHCNAERNCARWTGHLHDEIMAGLKKPNGLPIPIREFGGMNGICDAFIPKDSKHKGEEKMYSKPSVGRIVHYQSYGTPGGEYKSEPRAAIITEVCKTDNGSREFTEGVVSLAIMNPEGFFFNRNVPYSETPKGGHWNWPPRTE